MSKIDMPVLVLGILCLIGGILIAYFGFFAPPYLLLSIGMPVSGVMLLTPFILIFVGALMILGDLTSKSTPKKKKVKGAPSLLPPPPPSTAAARMCPTCGQPLTFIQQYDKWYCANCKKYS